MDLMFPIIAVPEAGGTSIEQLGTKEKFWYEDPELGTCLCKVVRPYTGEDWPAVTPRQDQSTSPVAGSSP